MDSPYQKKTKKKIKFHGKSHLQSTSGKNLQMIGKVKILSNTESIVTNLLNTRKFWYRKMMQKIINCKRSRCERLQNHKYS